MKILVFDTETGGTNSKKHSLLTLGALVGDLDTGEIAESFEVWNKLPSVDDYVIDPGAFKVHEITAQECMEKGISPVGIQTKFMDLFHSNDCTIMGGHNLYFDIRFMAYQVFKIEPEELLNETCYRIQDSMTYIGGLAGLDLVKGGQSLKQTIKLLKIDMSDIKGGYHGALYDAMAAFRVLCKFRKLFNDEEVMKKLIQ